MRRRTTSRAINIAVALAVVSAVTLAMVFTYGRRKVGPEVPVTAAPKPAPAAETRMQLVKWFPFSDENSLNEWEEKVFKGKVVYRIESREDLSFVRATSDAAASALYYKIKIDAKTRQPLVTWKWRVDKFPVKKNPENLEVQNEDDFAARVYVIFTAGFILNSKVLEYVWTETLPVGATGTSPYSKNIKLMVLESGRSEDGQWRTEERDILADYRKMFGQSPERDMGMVGFMTNTEHTRTSANAMYDDIKIGYRVDTDKESGKQ